MLSRPAQRGRGSPALQQISERIWLVGPASAGAPGEGCEVDQASQDSEAEAVQHVVGIIDPPARPAHEEPLRLPHSVTINGEDLAGRISGLRRPAKDTPRVTGRLQAVAAQLLVHEVLVGLGRRARHDPEGDTRLGAPSRYGPQVERTAGVGALYLEPGLPAEHRRVLQPGEETLGEPSGRRLRLADSPQRAVGLPAVAAQALEGALLETHRPSLSPRNATRG